MRLHRSLAAAAFGALLLAAPAFTPASAQTVGDILRAGAGDNPVIARVDGQDIRRAELIALLNQLPPQMRDMPMTSIYPLALERLIDGRLLVGAGRAANLQNDAEVQRRVADYLDQQVQQTYLTRAISAKLTDEELRKRYDEFVKANPPQEEVRARHILVATEQAARDVLAEVRRPGADFAAVARARSTDTSARDGGDLGFFGRQDMVPEFAEAAFGLQPGQVSQAPVRTQFGWHIIKVEQRRTGEVPTFEAAREQLRADATQEIAAEVVDELKGKAQVERRGLDGAAIPSRP
ncbi:MAG: peptidylprolyl isomerase [Alphaproteobacteria bacterium]|nr:peptidylprolyl isomerase [Alphaproteobacteria bacterium]